MTDLKSSIERGQLWRRKRDGKLYRVWSVEVSYWSQSSAWVRLVDAERRFLASNANGAVSQHFVLTRYTRVVGDDD